MDINICRYEKQTNNNPKVKYLKLRQFGSRLNMSFSNCEIFADKIIGLDEIKKKLVILENDTQHHQVNIIPLDQLSSISVKRIYNSINSGELKNKEIYEFLKSILLQFYYGNTRETIVLPVYESEINCAGDWLILERKVVNWQAILSKMIHH